MNTDLSFAVEKIEPFLKLSDSLLHAPKFIKLSKGAKIALFCFVKKWDRWRGEAQFNKYAIQGIPFVAKDVWIHAMSPRAFQEAERLLVRAGFITVLEDSGKWVACQAWKPSATPEGTRLLTRECNLGRQLASRQPRRRPNCTGFS